MKPKRNDLRTKRTIKNIRYAFCELIMEKKYSQISITELADLAEINRKTFYLHYSSLDELIGEMEHEIADSYLDYTAEELENRDIAGCIAKFYHYLDECDEVTERLMCDEDYAFFYEHVASLILDSEEFLVFFEGKRHPDIIKSYLVAVTSIYKSWLKAGRNIPIEDLIAYACDLILNGYNHANL